jgi:hypothetical protein
MFKHALHSKSVSAAMSDVLLAKYCNQQFHQNVFAAIQGQLNGEMA